MTTENLSESSVLTADMMLEAVNTYCPYCGEAVEISVDAAGGRTQSYVEDCPVCCRPWNVTIVGRAGGVWRAELQTSD